MEHDLMNGVVWYVVFLFSTVCHEAAHAWTAMKLGDDTAHRGGQVSLNPLPHIRREVVGMVVVPILSWLAGGWLIGWASAPYDPEWARRYPRRAGLMALAGPASNLGLVLAAALLMRVGMEWRAFEPPDVLQAMSITQSVSPGLMDVLAKLLSVVFSLNLLLFFFNMLPVPPLDGSNLPLLCLSASAAEKYHAMLTAPVLRLIGLVLAWRVIGVVFPDLLMACGRLLYPHVTYS